jgi:hypothetical protein
MDSTYWIVNNYGSNQTFSELTSISISGLVNVDSLIPEVYELFKRSSNATGDTWGDLVDRADSAGVTVLKFSEGNGITGFSQFTIGSGIACVTVSNTDDGGPGSLRSALECVQPGGGVIFDPAIDGDTIFLTSTVLPIDKDLSIFGRGVSNTVISGASIERVFEVRSGFNFDLSGLSCIGGNADAGRVVHNNGSLVLHDLHLIDHPTLPNDDNTLVENAPGAVVMIRENVEILE